MILASTNEGELVFDPFSGSGTALRVCQQTQRRCIGMEINAEYVEMTKNRLQKPFHGFDSIDERMTRIPNDLNDERIRDEYILNHINWFLQSHPDKANDFYKRMNEKYHKRTTPFNVEELRLLRAVK